MMLGGWGIVVGLLAVAWGLQMFLAYRQAQAFMKRVRALRAFGRTAIGVSSRSRFKRRVYVALAVDDTDQVVEAIKISGLTVWARPKLVAELRGRALDDLAADESTDLARAAAMAAGSLRGATSEEGEGERQRAGGRGSHDSEPDEAVPEEVNQPG
jgi:glucitol operon activator protein